MLEHSPIMIEQIAIRDYSNQQWAVLPGLVSPRTLAQFREDVLSAPRKRVTVGASKEYWTEYSLSSKSSLGIFLKSRQVFNLAQRAAGRSLFRQTTIWAQSYQAGERIAWHRDSVGEIQFLLCIQIPKASFGGRFFVRASGAEIDLNLNEGDGLLFKATALPHSTTRIVGPATDAPQRITSVVRFFARKTERAKHPA